MAAVCSCCTTRFQATVYKAAGRGTRRRVTGQILAGSDSQSLTCNLRVLKAPCKSALAEHVRHKPRWPQRNFDVRMQARTVHEHVIAV